MKKKNAFLLLELLIATMIISTTGVIISKTFSKEIKLTKVLFDYDLGINLCNRKIFEEESIIMKMKKNEFLKEYHNSGYFEEFNKFSWNSTLVKNDKFNNLYTLEVSINGLYEGRSINIKKYLRLNFNDEEK